MSINTERRLAAVDLGSNSFHMIVAAVDRQGHVRVIDRMRESVRLRSCLDENNNLSEDCQQRALNCLQRFGERLRHFNSDDVAIVGTNTLRQANNSHNFLEKAEQAIGHPVDVISGHEEARLIYLGVAHNLAETGNEQRLVMDIGGGSTELIIGQGFNALRMKSLHMGCVSHSLRFFPNGRLDKSCWKKALTAARLELTPIEHQYSAMGWEYATGASGTIRAVRKVIQQCELSPFGLITLDALYAVQSRLQKARHIDELELPGLSEERKPVFPGGLAILISTFEALGIQQMRVSDGALREGLLHDRLDRLQSGDIRDQTVKSLQKRFQVDKNHARQVQQTAMTLFELCQSNWALPLTLRKVLEWSAALHEVGLSVSHHNYQKHGGYLLENLDMQGFSREEQHWLSIMVRMHRRKLSAKTLNSITTGSHRYQHAIYMVTLLRLAILIHRSHNGSPAQIRAASAGKKSIRLILSTDEEQSPLLYADLEREQDYLKHVNMNLSYQAEADLLE